MTMTNCNSIVEKKMEQLYEIYFSKNPVNPEHAKAHRRRIQNSKEFIKELDDFKEFLPLKIVPKSSFRKLVNEADLASTQMDGRFCKVVAIWNYPVTDPVLVGYIAPITEV